LSAVVTGKEGGWTVSEQFKILPPKTVSQLFNDTTNVQGKC